MKPYVIGIDYGTLSGRCILADARDGRELAESVLNYAHGVMDETLPCGKKLPPQFALQHPADYLDVLRVTVPEVLRLAGVRPEEVAALGIDFTGCTILPVDREGTPLCFLPEYVSEPHAYVKLWKHHAAAPQAERINALAEERNEPWLRIYGGKISPEWMFPKVLEILEKAPQIYHATDRFTEAGDWLSRVLTGEETHGAMFAAYKALWNEDDGFPSDAFFTALHPAMHGIIGSKISVRVACQDEIAGKLSRAGAELTGLQEGTPLAMPFIDGHAAMPALGIVDEGEMMMILGTSGVQFLNARSAVEIPGICGYAKNGVIRGYCTYEAGQAGVGDIFDWFVRQGLPRAECEEAELRGIGVHQLLREKASRLKPGESGLLALDWINGNRSILTDSALSGMILGLTLQTRPEEIYRAWIESTAYGARMIMNTLEEGGLPVRRIVAAGGIAQKDAMMMQIYADVLGKELEVTSCKQAGAYGSAINAAVAGGIYPDLVSAIRKLSKPVLCRYVPIPENQAAYEKLYREYVRLHDYFGRGENPVMKKLREFQN